MVCLMKSSFNHGDLQSRDLTMKKTMDALINATGLYQDSLYRM